MASDVIAGQVIVTGMVTVAGCARSGPRPPKTLATIWKRPALSARTWLLITRTATRGPVIRNWTSGMMRPFASYAVTLAVAESPTFIVSAVGSATSRVGVGRLA